MPETGALIGYDSLFEIHDGGSPGSFQEVAEMFDLTPPSDTFDIIEASHMRSPNKVKEFINGMSDPGECSFTMNFIPDGPGDAIMQAWRADRGARRTCRITWPNGVTWTFSGLLQTYVPAAPTNDRMTAQVTIKVTASYEVTAAAAPANIVLPAVSGVAQVGQTLTALDGEWTGGGVSTYQWQEDDSGWGNIVGATSRTYVPVVGQIGNPLRVIVTRTNSEGSTQATSQPTADVIAA